MIRKYLSDTNRMPLFTRDSAPVLNKFGRLLDRWSVSGLVIAGILLFHILTLNHFPRPWVDEGLTGSRAVEFSRSGSPVGELDKRLFDVLNQKKSVLPVWPSFFYSLFVPEDAPISILPLRIVSFSFGAALLGIVFLIGKEIAGKPLALIWVVTLGMSPVFASASHVARADIMGTACGYLAVFIFLRAKNWSIWWHIVTGVIVSSAFELHPRSAICSIILFGLYVDRYGLRFLQRRETWLFVVGGVIGLGIIAFVHIYPDYQNFISNMQIFHSGRTPPGGRGFLRVGESFGDVLLSISNLQGIQQGLFFFAPLVLLKYFDRNSRTVLIVGITSLIGGALLLQNKDTFTFIILEPAITLWIATVIFLICCHKLPKLNFQSPLIVVVSSLFFINSVLAIGQVAISERSCHDELDTITHAIRSVSKPNEFVISDETYWIKMQDYHFMPWKTMISYQRIKNAASLTDAFKYFRPDYLVTDKYVRYFLSDSSFDDTFREELRMSLTELVLIINTYGKLERTISSHCYGEVEIFKFNWNQ